VSGHGCSEAGAKLKLGLSEDDGSYEQGLQEIADELLISKQRAQQLLQSGLFKALVILQSRGLTFDMLCPSGRRWTS
jgi:hypothetical protein